MLNLLWGRSMETGHCCLFPDAKFTESCLCKHTICRAASQALLTTRNVCRTRDLGGSTSTSDFTKAILDRLS